MAINYFATETNLEWDVKPCDIIINEKIVPTHYGLVRDDTNEVMEIHKNSYNPFYNAEFRSLLDDLQKISGFDNLTYQEFKGGKVVLGYLENNKTDVKVNGFDINKYLVLGNSHDGSKGIFLGTSEIMLRCMNQFGKIVKSDVIKHTKNNFSKIDDLKRAYEVYFRETEKQVEMYCKMNKINIDSKLIEMFTKNLFEANEEKISTRKENIMIDFQNSINIETADLGNNLFGLFNSVTHYTTHKLKNENTFGNLFGTANKINQKAYDLVLELI